ncbi:DegT/DnrJ/EryC1/StrS family aminotransferase [Lederbergia citrea]|uniref:DegT/DnrJ/EryC1/StrS family aminotransferase n=1 Tax=Lederbergia citrea TaxID=2833581 RepID=UPI001BC9D54A|nr:aminotransferase class I/II-fold pyridoxal phosphate-dependent enzyme [Lederbergia citrea]MBS4179148.1 aminotransferase class I/II-fold pyridoxal phosphate-dependent enzyme [Lederbergia citrea]
MFKSKNKSKIYLSPPHLSGNEMQYIQEAINTNWIAPLGPNVDAFENEIARYVGATEAVAVSSGTAAIHLALSLLDVKKGDTVFCSTLTFVASANPILYQGAEPVFIDSEPETWNMSPEALETAFREADYLGKLPKAVIVVNLYGQSAKMDEILSICNHYDVPIIEDAAESLGSSYKEKPSGSFGKFGVFSFNGNKIITTSGGGMLVSDDAVAIKKARFLATQSRDQAPHYQHSEIGYNYRMSNILAGIGRGQLKVLEERVMAKRIIFSKYYQALSHIRGIHFMPELENTRSNRWLTTLIIDEEAAGVSSSDLLQYLAEENIEARPVWKPLHLQPLFDGAKYYHHQDRDVAEQLFTNGLCLPSGSNISVEEMTRVVECLKRALKPKVYTIHPIGINEVQNNDREKYI